METNNKVDNLASLGELTVTIPLNEYRALMCSSISKKYELEKAVADWVKARRELQEAQETIADLKGQIIKLIMPEVPTNE